MIDEYQKYLVQTVNELSKVGFKLIEDSDYIARFEHKDGWQLSLEGERFNRPLIDIDVTPPKENQGFSLRILMNTYQKLENIQQPPPSLVNQLSFFKANFDGWLLSVGKYKQIYKEINESFF